MGTAASAAVLTTNRSPLVFSVLRAKSPSCRLSGAQNISSSPDGPVQLASTASGPPGYNHARPRTWHAAPGTTHCTWHTAPGTLH